jgi:branched-chain amino acid transport system ATP-binding protein
MDLESTGVGISVEALDVRYGFALAVKGVSFEVAAGSVLAVLGANGAGKSSTARACAGLVRASGGKIRIGDKDVTAWSADRIRKTGLVYLPEIRGVFPNLTVAENVRMAVRLTRERRASLEMAYDLFPILANRRSQRAGSLSGGEQQMLSLVRALAGDPKVVIVDEPSLGLAPLIVEQVFQSLERAKQLGVTMVVIEQFAHRALTMADQCIILRQGKVSWSGPATEAETVLSEHYLGTTVKDQDVVRKSAPS